MFPPVARKARVQLLAAEVWRAIFGAVWRFHCVVLLLLVGAHCVGLRARLAQSAERKALNLVVVGSSPTVGVFAGRVSNMVVVGGWSKMDTLGIEPRAFRMQSGCGTTTQCARHRFPHRRFACCMLGCPPGGATQATPKGIRTPAGRAQWISSPSP